jgi:hypothetical protein
MKAALLTIVLCILGWAAAAAEVPAACNPAAYNPDFDVYGRRVAPADLMPPVTAEIDPYVIVDVQASAPPVRRGHSQRHTVPGNASIGIYLNGFDSTLNTTPCVPPQTKRNPQPPFVGK